VGFVLSLDNRFKFRRITTDTSIARQFNHVAVLIRNCFAYHDTPNSKRLPIVDKRVRVPTAGGACFHISTDPAQALGTFRSMAGASGPRRHPPSGRGMPPANPPWNSPRYRTGKRPAGRAMRASSLAAPHHSRPRPAFGTTERCPHFPGVKVLGRVEPREAIAAGDVEVVRPPVQWRNQHSVMLSRFISRPWRKIERHQQDDNTAT